MPRPLTLFLITVAACIVVIGAVFVLHGRSTPSPTSTSTTATTTVDLGNGVYATLPPGTTIKEVPSSVEEPDLNMKVTYSSDLPADAVTELKTDIAAREARLKKDPTQSYDWYQLAIDYKIAGDYSAAEAVWVYLTQVVPGDYTAFADLGDLYQNFLKDYPKAEQNYLKALSLKPDDIGLYYDLYIMYTGQYKVGTSAAADIVARGLKNNPGDKTLLGLQQQINASK
ncbi:MAG TPA: hypothetical protein VG753_03615 [Candidatus Paceibacterota bacterium]|nr:hypothetical protein [Candidatus Paceibacterota bacterium]